MLVAWPRAPSPTGTAGRTAAASFVALHALLSACAVEHNAAPLPATHCGALCAAHGTKHQPSPKPSLSYPSRLSLSSLSASLPDSWVLSMQDRPLRLAQSWPSEMARAWCGHGARAVRPWPLSRPLSTPMLLSCESGMAPGTSWLAPSSPAVSTAAGPSCQTRAGADELEASCIAALSAVVLVG